MKRAAAAATAWIFLCAASIAAAQSSTTAPPEFRIGEFSIEIDGHQINGAAVQPGEHEIIQKIEANGVRVERRIKVGPEDTRIRVTIFNDTAHAVSLGTARLVEAKREAWAHLSGSPAAVFVSGDSTLMCQPHAPATAARDYGGTTVLALAPPEKNDALVIGYLSAAVARPSLSGAYRPGTGITFTATQQLLGRTLPSKQSIDLDEVYLARGNSPFAALERYVQAVANVPEPATRKTHATALWCSWYAHRMDVSEDLVLANAAIAAKYFKPLGFEIMQLDHGWQSGDITGDWTVDRASFPHGLKWLADELQSRYGLKLGLWIAPTDVAETSDLYKKHADWLLKDDAGKPRVNWKWYWKPNPNCYELDATNPAAGEWMRQTFARLTAEGAAYYKIDFIAASGQEAFVQSDPNTTRGWTNLRSAMEAIRAGAGETAWIRYCQTPPLLSRGLADSTIGGDDTLDAGVPGTFHVLRDNARSLAAGYWLNDRLYHREVCDMSVRMQADVEEARLRLAMMSLAGCSISFSDELQHLPPSRIEMMQQVLPPGAPPMRPIDLFDRDVPSIWHLHCANAEGETWDIVGLFNFEESAEPRTVRFADLGLENGKDYSVFEFWEQRFVGVCRDRVTLTLAPHTSRVLCIRRVTGAPQVVGTDMHVLQGVHELRDVRWDAGAVKLSGHCIRARGMHGKVFIYVPPEYAPRFDFPLRNDSAHLTHLDGPLWAREVDFADASDIEWSIPFTHSK